MPPMSGRGVGRTWRSMRATTSVTARTQGEGALSMLAMGRLAVGRSAMGRRATLAIPSVARFATPDVHAMLAMPAMCL